MKHILISVLITLPIWTSAQSSDSITLFDSLCLSNHIYEKVEQMPFYFKGMANLLENLNSNVIIEDSTKGNLKIIIVLNCKGRICSYKFERGINSAIDEQIITVLLNNQNWRPAIQNGTPVNCRIALRFKISEGEIKTDY